VISFHVLVLVLLSFATIAAMSNVPIVGGISQLEGNERKEALELLDATLAQLANGDGPSYK